jgi:glycosyltransferase involved in cell wall biosynthesis
LTIENREILVDLSRLVTRFSRPAPNGIDRVDLMYARHFLQPDQQSAGVCLGPTGPRLISRASGHAVTTAIAAHWSEGGAPETDAQYQALRSRLVEQKPPRLAAQRHETHDRRARLLRTSSLWREGLAGAGRLLLSRHGFRQDGLLRGRSIERAAAPNAIYLNVSQFPLWIDSCFAWLGRRADVRAVFFVHDLLPITLPEFFPAAEAERHRRRLEVLSRYASTIIVAADETRQALVDHFQRNSLKMPKISVLALPAASSLVGAVEVDEGLRSRPYFVSVGTLEPRKNQLLLLQVWRELAARMGATTPKLLLIGARGWDNENIVDMIERCPALRETVLEVNDLSTPAMRTIVSNARAMLLPSFAEGFGLPIGEAIMLGTPTIAADISIFRAVGGDMIAYLDTVDGVGWLGAIEKLLLSARPSSGFRNITAPVSKNSEACYLRNIEDLLRCM